ncbi:hypothetical protein CG692_24380 [Escherichia coli]|nr:hypothetical protein CG692_24380 [Escherichia coli]
MGSRKGCACAAPAPRGRIHPRRMHKTGYLSLSVNLRWRLLSRDGGQSWEVMSHERYSKLKDRK